MTSPLEAPADTTPLFIAIDGRSGSGKSTLAEKLHQYLRVNTPPSLRVSLLHVEDFYPGWNGLDSGISSYQNAISQLAEGKIGRWRGWDWEADRAGEHRMHTPTEIIICEGVGASLLGSRITREDLPAIRVYLELDREERKRRALLRDGESYVPHWDAWADQENTLLGAVNMPESANLLINTTVLSAHLAKFSDSNFALKKTLEIIELYALGCHLLPAETRAALMASSAPAEDESSLHWTQPWSGAEKGSEFAKGRPGDAELDRRLLEVVSMNPDGLWLDSSNHAETAEQIWPPLQEEEQVSTENTPSNPSSANRLSPGHGTSDALNVHTGRAQVRNRYSIFYPALSAHEDHVQERVEFSATHALGSGPGWRYRIPIQAFDWLGAHWPEHSAPELLDSPDTAGSPVEALKAPQEAPQALVRRWLGWVGQFSYETYSSAAKGPPRTEVQVDSGEGSSTSGAVRAPDEDRGEDPGAVVGRLFRADRALLLDHHQRTLTFLANSVAGRRWAQKTLDKVRATSITASEEGTHADDSGLRAQPRKAGSFDFVCADSPESYRAKIAAAQACIEAGDTYEVCLTTRLEAPLGEDQRHQRDWLDLYLQLRKANPTSFGAYFRLGDFAMLSTSPERFLAVSADGQLLAEPIKGTMARTGSGNGSVNGSGADPDSAPGTGAASATGTGPNDNPSAGAITDLMNARALHNSSKERAENLMIVDLLRNDLSRYAQTGSVRVKRLFAVERFPRVLHMVSTIWAQLRPGAPRAQAIAAAFPPGSMTGAPKARTMQILRELEGTPRGPYSGFLGYFAADGSAELSVVIRTLVVEHGKVSLGVGGAITADSDPAAEWAEVKAKALGILQVLGVDFPDSAAGAD